MSEINTFLFADLAGYTALTEAHGDEHAADLAGRFFESVRGLLTDYGAQEVKSIGDALMLRSTEPAGVTRLAVRIVNDFGARAGFPHVRAGIHTGPAVSRDGDWFGATVNVAARVADLAHDGEVLITRATRDAIASEHPELELRPLGRRRLKNVRDPVEVFAAVTRTDEFARGYPLDPVCRMGVDTAEPHERRTFAGREYYFCSKACHDAFHADPHHYARRGRGARRRDLRISDDARERGARELRSAYGEGRVTHEELEERVAQAYGASTRGELSAVLADIPHRGLHRRPRRGRVVWRAFVFPWRMVGRFLLRPIRRRRLRRGS